MATPYRDFDDDDKREHLHDSAAASDDGYSVITMSTASSASDAEKEALMAHDKALAGEPMLIRRTPPSRLARVARGASRLLFFVLAAVGLLNLLSWSPPWGRHFPPHHGPPHGPPPHGPHPGLPHVLDCFDLSNKHAAINFTITLPHPGAAVHLLPSLSGADVRIHRDDHGESLVSKAGGPPPPPPPPPHGPPHVPHDGPPPPPPPPPHGPPGGPHRGPHGPPHRPHEKPQTILVKAKRVEKGDAKHVFITSEDNDDDKKASSVHLCAIRLPFGQTGLGLFHEPPKKHAHGHDDKKQDTLDDDKKEKEPKPKPEPHSFPNVSLEFDMPAGAPFTLTTGLPPHPPFHHGPPPHGPHFPWGRHRHAHKHKHPHHKQHGKHGHAPSMMSKFMHRVGCSDHRQANAKPAA